jgi:hypothetical protein
MGECNSTSQFEILGPRHREGSITPEVRAISAGSRMERIGKRWRDGEETEARIRKAIEMDASARMCCSGTSE